MGFVYFNVLLFSKIPGKLLREAFEYFGANKDLCALSLQSRKLYLVDLLQQD